VSDLTRFDEKTTGDEKADEAIRRRVTHRKCKQARIMRDSWRGALNEVITLLGVMTVWQVMFEVACVDDRCIGFAAPVNILKGFFADARKVKSVAGLKGYALAALKLVATVAVTFVPTYANFVNTAEQHRQGSAADYDLPTCFDDDDSDDDQTRDGARAAASSRRRF
jgi:hypothetical protein